MTSKFTREELLNIIETDHVQCGEASALARMALAAMNSEPEYLPLDYLQGHRDGLEWSARLAESNHPQTGDWLYDDPIELAKAIRKGPDMPPAQPVAGSEPDRNPVLAYADSYRDMAKQGVQSVPIWSVITDLERNIAPLYRHAQPVPVVPDDVLAAIQKVARIRLDLNDFDGDRRGIADCLYDAEEALIEVVNRRAAMLQAQSDDYGEPTDDERIMAIEGIHNCERCSDGGWVIGEMGITRCACGQADSSPVIPGAEQRIADAVELLQKAAPAMLADNSGSDGPLAGRMKSPVIPDAWIPVSERMPEAEGHYLVWANASRIDGYCDHLAIATYQGGEWSNEFNWLVTHWMPLPAAPQEVKSES